MIDVIEAKIIDTLKNASGLHYLTTVETYGGELDGDIGEIVRRYPAIWVVYAGSQKPQKIGPEKYKTTATFALIHAARNVKNEASTRKGSVGEVGVYQILKDSSTLMLNSDLGLEIDHFQPGAVRSLYNTKVRGMALSVFSQEWTTQFIQAVPTKEAVDLLSFGVNYFIKPGDDVADATDVINLGV